MLPQYVSLLADEIIKVQPKKRAKPHDEPGLCSRGYYWERDAICILTHERRVVLTTYPFDPGGGSPHNPAIPHQGPQWDHGEGFHGVLAVGPC